MDLLATALDILLPHRCVLCRQTSGGGPLCVGCRADLPWLGSSCRRCALPLPRTTELCGECLRRAPSFDRCRSAFCYATPVDRLIGQFKHQGHLSAGRLLSELFLQILEGDELYRPDLIAPVPLHWRRQLRRGFNQAGFLAERWARELNLPLVSIGKRRHATPRQQQLNRKQRLRNLREAFVVEAERVRGRQVVIVDDVVTTGATAEALSFALKQAGAERVEVWALARTPAPG